MNEKTGPFAKIGSARRGIAWMLLSILIATVMDTTAKYLTQFYPVLQIIWARYIFQAVLVFIVLAPRLPRLAQTNRLGMQLLRSAILLAASIFFLFGLRSVPLADASAIMFMAPLIVIALSVPLLKERVGPRRWMAVVVGLIGALIIVRPGVGVMQTAALFPVGTAVLYAFYMIATRHLSHTDSPVTTLIYTACVGAVVMSAIAPFVWIAPDMKGWLLLVVLGCLGAGCHFALIKAFDEAAASAVTPFEYSRLIWATVLGFLVFGDLPDGWTIVGATLIVAAGLYVYRRESRTR
ncbi:MAG: DMT family transporter [Rhodospirillales bacterium]|jgi:drug/metabolite transporter (DMT)-like permease|nr:DMT family transporter [Rhodospirillales bacterium]